MVDKMNEPKTEWREECPRCGTKATYIQELGDKVIEEKMLPEKAKMFLKIEEGTVPPNQVLNQLPLGTTVYHYVAGLDICKKCHMVYARMVQIGTATKRPNLAKPELILPNDIINKQQKAQNN